MLKATSGKYFLNDVILQKQRPVRVDGEVDKLRKHRVFVLMSEFVFEEAGMITD
jgi:hypothetical protein